MQRTLKRELKVLEIVKREAFQVPLCSCFWQQKLATHSQLNSAHSHRHNARSFLLPIERELSKVHSKGSKGDWSGATQVSFFCFAFIGEL